LDSKSVPRLKWCVTLVPSIHQGFVHHIIKRGLLIISFAFMRINNNLNFLDNCIPHLIYQMKTRFVGVGNPDHVIDWIGESKDVVNIVPPKII